MWLLLELHIKGRAFPYHVHYTHPRPIPSIILILDLSHPFYSSSTYPIHSTHPSLFPSILIILDLSHPFYSSSNYPIHSTHPSRFPNHSTHPWPIPSILLILDLLSLLIPLFLLYPSLSHYSYYIPPYPIIPIIPPYPPFLILSLFIQLFLLPSYPILPTHPTLVSIIAKGDPSFSLSHILLIKRVTGPWSTEHIKSEKGYI